MVVFTLAAGSRCLKSHQRLRNHRVISFLFGPEISFSPSYKYIVQANGFVDFVLTRRHAGGLGVAFVKMTSGRRRSSIATEIPVTNAAGTAGHRIKGFHVAVTPSSAASTFTHDGLAAKAAKQFDETKFALVAVVKGRKNDIKFVFAFI